MSDGAAPAEQCRSDGLAASRVPWCRVWGCLGARFLSRVGAMTFGNGVTAGCVGGHPLAGALKGTRQVHVRAGPPQ